MYRPGTSAVWADALFASMLQRSDGPSAGQVRKAVAAAMRAYGGRGCAERVAQEFGDHPETAVARMRWAREVVGEVFAAPRPARDGRRRRPPLRDPGQRRWRLVSRSSASVPACRGSGVSAAGRRTCQTTRETPTWCGPRRWPGPGRPAHPGPAGRARWRRCARA